MVGHDRPAPVNRLLGRRSPIYDIQHLQLFCPGSLRELLERAGFRDVQVRRFRTRYPLRYWLRSAPLGPRTKHCLIAALDRLGSRRQALGQNQYEGLSHQRKVVSRHALNLDVIGEGWPSIV